MKKKYHRLMVFGIAVATHFSPYHSTAQEVSCYAGNGERRFLDGQAICYGASFHYPTSSVADSKGNLYVSDYVNHSIRKITPDGIVTTLAGAGIAGDADGTGAAAYFNLPYAITIDGSGNLYVTDGGNNKIKKITPEGVVTTIAGTGEKGTDDGIGTVAKFNNPQGITIDAAGNLYIADSQNNKIRKITSGGIVTTVAGSGAVGDIAGIGTGATFNNPRGLVFDAAGNLYIADSGNSKIRRMAPNGMVYDFTVSKSPGYSDGAVEYAQFAIPIGLAIDASGKLYIADSGNNVIRVISAGKVSTVAGNFIFGNSDGKNATFNAPTGITIDGKGNLYVADFNNNKIRKIDQDGIVSTYAGTGAFGREDGPSVSPMFNKPSFLTIDQSGNMYISDNLNQRIRKITPDGLVSTIAGNSYSGGFDGTGTDAWFSNPEGIVSDNHGNLYIADAGNNKIRKITSEGVVTSFAGIGNIGSTDGTGNAVSFNMPVGIAIDASGNLYVSDSQNNKIRKITPDGTVSTIAGSGLKGNADGAGTAASFNNPCGITVDGSGNLYIADKDNSTIRKISPDGIVTSLGNILYPYGICLNPNGGLYVTSYGSFTIHTMKFTGSSQVIAGTTLVSGNIDGKGTEAQFNRPKGIAVDAHGNLYIADSENSKIRKITMPTVSSIGQQVHNTGIGFIYPNPVQDKLYLKDAGINSYEIINAMGQVQQKGITDNNGIDVSTMDSGIYLLKIGTDQSSAIQRFIKE